MWSSLIKLFTTWNLFFKLWKNCINWEQNLQTKRHWNLSLKTKAPSQHIGQWAVATEILCQGGVGIWHSSWGGQPHPTPEGLSTVLYFQSSTLFTHRTRTPGSCVWHAALVSWLWSNQFWLLQVYEDWAHRSNISTSLRHSNKMKIHTFLPKSF